MMIELAPEVNRAFSAYVLVYFTNPWALPQAGNEVAPLALKCPNPAPLHSQRLVEILDQVVGVFEADGHAQ